MSRRDLTKGRPASAGAAASAVLAAALVLWTATGCAARTPGGGLPAPDEITLSAPVSVPMDTEVGPPVISARLNGHGPYRFILDTGAAGSVFAENLAREVGLPALAKASMGRPDGAAPLPATLTRVERIELDGLTLTGVPAVYGDLSVLRAVAPDVRGVLSVPMLRGLLVTFDYPRQRVEIRRGELPEPDEQTVFAWPDTETVPSLPADVAGQPVRLTLDTGSNSGFVLPRTLVDSLTWRETPAPSRAIRTVDAASPTLAGRLNGALQLGAYTFDDPRVTYREVGDRATVGYQVLREFVVTLDPEKHRVSLRRE